MGNRDSILSSLENKESRFNKAKVQSMSSKAKLIEYTNCGNISVSVEDFIEKVEALIRKVEFNPHQEKELLKTLLNNLPVEFTGIGGANSVKERG